MPHNDKSPVDIARELLSLLERAKTTDLHRDWLKYFDECSDNAEAICRRLVELQSAVNAIDTDRIAKLERVAEAAKSVMKYVNAYETNDVYRSAEALRAAIADLEKP